MKITSFNPIIIGKDSDATVELFKELGFEHKHTKTGINDDDITSFDLKDPNGFRVNIAKVDQLPQTMTAIRMNVDDFEEAYEFLIAQGFTDTQGGHITNTGTSKATLMVSPSGFAISLAQHIKS